MTLEQMLESLAEDWDVELTRIKDTWALAWRLTITPIRLGQRSFTYRGTLASVVRRAYAGEPEDARDLG